MFFIFMSTYLEDNSYLQINEDRREDYVQSDLLRNVGPKLSLKYQHLIYSLYKRGSTFSGSRELLVLIYETKHSCTTTRKLFRCSATIIWYTETLEWIHSSSVSSVLKSSCFNLKPCLVFGPSFELLGSVNTPKFWSVPYKSDHKTVQCQ